MMQLPSVLLLSVCAVLLCTFADVQSASRKEKRNKKKGRQRCKTTHKISAGNLDKSGFFVDCDDQLVSNLSVVGNNGSCQGLTIGLFVQMSSCFWENNCTLSYDTKAINYMLKLTQGEPKNCVTKQPSTFTLSYDCTKKKDYVYDVMGPDVIQKKVKDGIVRSHENHPWHYKRSDSQPGSLTFQRPKKKLSHFVYTIRSLGLALDDTLEMKWTDSQKESQTKNLTTSDIISLTDDIKKRTGAIKAEAVTFSLDTAPNTHGRDGFVICFRWMKWRTKHEIRGFDACKKLIVPKKWCKQRKSKRGGSGKQ